MITRWQNSDAPRGDDYDARWRALAAQGRSIHGEADLVDALLHEAGGTRVLDAGCGTGRVAIELATRGYRVTGVDVDPAMLSTARDKAPELRWLRADLADLAAVTDERFDLVVLAGNVMIFVDPGSEGAVLAAAAGRLVDGGILVAGFQILPDRLSLQRYDELAEAAGLQPVARWSTWNRDPFTGGDYAVTVHARSRS
ncbi:class I SAM-dependent methyltransferase [Mycolicibacterium sp. YH-1]|uniref:class I SAM-dependent DNA methyltransferase n=1 Tax=Mycolicibacterium sp. YH-1 TaxID=2908837 RepID=UPI001F4C300A|nr:class I SAM-dependent methyltransferase [Mycolicibacterium sp. YH-1]UNB55706.1 class I SAM-dependent methyltransferase [Mycolicibacterium sp. YH-1]